MEEQNNRQTPPSLPEGQDFESLLKTFWKQLVKTTVFGLAAVTVIVFGSIAWFAANHEVQSGTNLVSAGFEPINLATRGDRQTPEEDYLTLGAGNTTEYDGDTYYYTGGDCIALRLSEQYSVSPGASGSVTFYILPNRDGAGTVTLYFGLAGYKLYTNEKGKDIAVPVGDPVLEALLSGHILLFGSKSEDGVYSNWLFSETDPGFLDNTLTVTLNENTKKDVPVPVTLHWIWPLRYENMKQLAETHTPLSEFIEAQAAAGSEINADYHYSRIFVAKKTDYTDGKLPEDKRSKAYDLADEYIGSNAGYLYLTIQTNVTYN